MKVFAFSLITNKCETEYETHGETNHEDVVTIGFRRQDSITRFVTALVEKINQSITAWDYKLLPIVYKTFIISQSAVDNEKVQPWNYIDIS